MSNCEVKLIALTKPVDEGILTAENLVTWCARVSSPQNQENTSTAPKLISYLLKNKHWSPFEMVNIVFSITTTRDIGRQILRHWSFKIDEDGVDEFTAQEFSQRYAAVSQFAEPRECRLQDSKNRQSSLETDDEALQDWWKWVQQIHIDGAATYYEEAIKRGIAREQARVILPEGLTLTTMYLNGNLRSWVHFCELRCANGTQKEHREVAIKVRAILAEHFPNVAQALQWN